MSPRRSMMSGWVATGRCFLWPWSERWSCMGLRARRIPGRWWRPRVMKIYQIISFKLYTFYIDIFSFHSWRTNSRSRSCASRSSSAPKRKRWKEVGTPKSACRRTSRTQRALANFNRIFSVEEVMLMMIYRTLVCQFILRSLIAKIKAYCLRFKSVLVRTAGICCHNMCVP